jgi:hypothetical protein
MGLKFMQRAEQTRKEQAKEQAKMLIDQIKEDAEDSQEEEAKKNFVKGADRFGGKALQIPNLQVKKHDDEDLKKAAQRL